MSLIISCHQKTTQSEVTNFISLNSIENLNFFRNYETISPEKREQTLINELRSLKASPAQINTARSLLSNSSFLAQCDKFKDKSTNAARTLYENISLKALYANFSKNLITNPKDALKIKGDHIDVPKNLKDLHNRLFFTSDLYDISVKRADLYSNILDRGLKANGTIDEQFAIPEMAAAFEHIEKEFLLFRKALNSNPEGFKSFIKTFGVSDPQLIELAAKSYTDRLNSIIPLYESILSKIKSEGNWNGLKYMDLMTFYDHVYQAMSFEQLPGGLYNNFTKVIQFNPYNIETIKYHLSIGKVDIISIKPLKKYTSFISSTTNPLYDAVTPNSFMSDYDGVKADSKQLIIHDLEHTGMKNEPLKSEISEYFLAIKEGRIKVTSLEALKATIKSKLDLNLEEIKKFNLILKQLNSADQNIFITLAFIYLHETREYNSLANNNMALGTFLKKIVNDSHFTNIQEHDSFYRWTQSFFDTDFDPMPHFQKYSHLRNTLLSLQTNEHNIFDRSSDGIVKAALKYLK